MPESDKPNVGASLIRVHLVITRALKVAQERSLAFAQHGFPDASVRAGFASYVRTLVSVLHGHHKAEDELAFPFLRQTLPNAPYDLLAHEHQLIEPILPEIETAIDQAEAGEQPVRALNDLHHALGRLVEIWRPHIGKEEYYFSVEKLAQTIEVEEHVRVNRLLAEFSQQHTGPDYLVIPFILYNLPDQDRAVMSQAMPPVVTQQLVPVAWKEKWAPMRPFLLESAGTGGA